ncbi:uroporphyrinogen-III synthase [Rhodoferax ferrireducens]|uniref:uroporphyrinogen-III synthase n=1 Tax=Rhodoferax ferrireducens TaxID=192843 RepID=UPI00298DAFE6|nr:uroporphyrinogen-III synthase [Rhodoferax ferrireducens]WPC68573.1 uroporphyrinogen-III synthase [Rhodoferax ferrireducens]
MRVIVTRPQREAQQWVLDLSAQGLQAVALPLIEVGPVHDTADVVRAWQHLGDYVGVMFVSGNAVDYFFRSNSALAPVFIGSIATKTRAWATGPGTARALLRQGVEPARLDAPPVDASQLDSEALWQVVGPQVQPGDRVLIVRGGDSLGSAAASSNAAQGAGRDWFANRVMQAGGRPEFVMAYQRGAPEFGCQARELAQQAATDGSVWLFSSTQAVVNLSTCLPGQSWAGARAVATHPRIAAAARQAGFGVVQESRPTLPELVACFKLMQQTAH